MNTSELYDNLTKLVEAGDETGARAFVTEHIMEFPEDVREKIVFEFFKEALASRVQNTAAIKEFQKTGKDAMETVLATDAELENQAKLIELKEQLAK